MKTVITKKIDGFLVVSGISSPVIDPAATRPTAAALLSETDEQSQLETSQASAAQELGIAWSQVETKKEALMTEEFSSGIETLLHETTEYQSYLAVKETVDTSKDEDIQKLSDAWKKVVAVKIKIMNTGGERVNAALLETEEYADWLTVKSEQNVILQSSRQILLNKNKEIVQQNAIYLTPRAGEEIVDEEEAAAFAADLAALPENTLLLRDGQQITDLRNKKYWTQDAEGVWSEGVIATLGEKYPETAVPAEELSDEQRAEIIIQLEETRIDTLSDDDRRAEFVGLAEGLKKRAALMKQELEIDGETAADALAQAQTWYQAEVQTLWEKFGLTRNGQEYCEAWAGTEVWSLYWFG